MNARRIAITIAVFVVVAVVGAMFRRAHADGIPTGTPLYYSGFLQEGGTAVDGTRAITVSLWTDGTSTGTPLCQTVASTANVIAGRFRIALDGRCAGIVNANNN